MCTHVENVYIKECGVQGKRCAKQINPCASDSVCLKCLGSSSPLERHRAIAYFYDGLKEYLAKRFKLTNTLDRDILEPQVQRIMDVIEEQKSNALVELELKIAIEVGTKKTFGEELAEESGGGWI